MSARAPAQGCLTVLGGGAPKCAANPGLTPSSRRTLPETGCLSQGLPTGTCCPFVVPPKRLSTPLSGRGPCAFGHGAPQNGDCQGLPPIPAFGIGGLNGMYPVCPTGLPYG